ncbi:MAG: hypothetical protein RSG77_21565 [Hafnia sp.]
MKQEHDISIFPVIHHLDEQTTLAQADIAFEAQADGVFLISHFGNDAVLPFLGKQIKKKYPDKQVGLNFLSRGPRSALAAVHDFGLDMMWDDNCGVSSRGIDTLAYDMENINQFYERLSKIFASVAFKYQPAEPNPALAAQNAKSLNFVPTTSGSATGEPPSVEKIESMSAAVQGDLAVASGMTVENIHLYAPHLRYVLVATGVSEDEHHFDFERLYRFIALAKKSKADSIAEVADPAGGE